jgi:hypothetical protein
MGHPAFWFMYLPSIDEENRNGMYTRTVCTTAATEEG